MNLQEQLDALRDGDIARAEFRGGNAVEGRVQTTYAQKFIAVQGSGNGVSFFTLDDATSVTVLRPRLRKGDRVRHKPTGRVAFFDHMVSDDDALLFEFEDHTYPKTWLVTDCECLPDEPAPPPETVEVGQWWQLGSTPAHVVMEVHPDGTATMRAAREHLDRGGVFKVEWVVENMTLLDGPPEPPVGAVVAVRRDGGEWRITHRYRDHEPSWCIDGLPGAWYWRGMFDGTDPSTLRVLAVLETP